MAESPRRWQQEGKVYTDMEMWNDIRRRVLVEGESKRSIQREYGIHWKTLKKILEHSEPPGYRMNQPRRKRKIGPYLPIIEQILKDDKKEHKKHRHTAKRILDRLRDEHGFDGCYTIVKDAVRELRLSDKEVFVPLEHKPGEAQVDFGAAKIEYEGERISVAVFEMSLPYSGAIFTQVYPRECTESFQDGHRRAFEFFGFVPWRITYDNSKIAVRKIIGAHKRELTREFLRLQSHYLFESHFCNVRKPNEKGAVENLVGYSRRNFLVPVPKVENFDDLNEYLALCCINELKRTLRGRSVSKGELFEEEKKSMLPLPRQSFEARRIEHTKVNSMLFVRFDRNDYSAPMEYAYRDVKVVGTIDEVRIIYNNHLIARHKRCWKKENIYYNPVHYLRILERKPGAFDIAKPLSRWELPECFGVLRRRFERKEEKGGLREYIKVLRLLENSSIKELKEAIEYALDVDAIDCDAIKLILEYRRERPCELFNLDGRPHLKSVFVEDIDLASYGELMSYELAET